MSKFSENLKYFRNSKNVSQASLAETIGVSHAVIGFWEKEINEPTLSNIIKLCDYFGVTADYLIGREE